MAIYDFTGVMNAKNFAQTSIPFKELLLFDKIAYLGLDNAIDMQKDPEFGKRHMLKIFELLKENNIVYDPSEIIRKIDDNTNEHAIIQDAYKELSKAYQKYDTNKDTVSKREIFEDGTISRSFFSDRKSQSLLTQWGSDYTDSQIRCYEITTRAYSSLLNKANINSCVIHRAPHYISGNFFQF